MIILIYLGNDIVPTFNYVEVEKVWKDACFISQNLENVFCFGRVYASRFDFLSTKYRLNSKHHFRRTCVYCVFVIVVFRYLLLHKAIRLLSFTFAAFLQSLCRLFYRGKYTDLEMPSKVFFSVAMIFFQHYTLLRLKRFWKSSSFFWKLPKDFCFGRLHASCFDFLSVYLFLNSKRHFRTICVYCVYCLVI